MKVFRYSKWSNFKRVIDKAKVSCKLSNGNIQEHFANVRKVLIVGNDACDTHYAVGKVIRKTIQDLGGTMPEDLPTPEASIQKLEQEELKKINGSSVYVYVKM